MKAFDTGETPAALPNLERAAQLLNDMPALWSHPGVTDEQREALVREMFEQVRLRGTDLVAIEPKPEYQPLFAYSVWRQDEVNGVGARGLEPPTSASRTLRATKLRHAPYQPLYP